MKRRMLVLLVIALTLFLFLFTAFLTSANPGAPGTPTLRWVRTSATTAEIRADGLTNGGTAGNGAISWDIYFRFPVSVSSPYPVVGITAGPAWTGMSPCTFATNVSMNQPSVPGTTGDRGVFINGFCTTGVPNNPVTGSNVLVASVTFAACPAGSAGFVMDLDSGDDVFGASVADVVDRNNDPFNLSDTNLTDGTLMCAPNTFSLTVTTAGLGSGIVTPPVGVYTYAAGTVITVTASANLYSIFSGWGGDCSGSGSCVVTMTANRSVVANFNQYRIYLPLVAKNF
jgi:hypothetical protein